MKISKKELVLHITGCFAFMAIPLLLFPRPPEESLSFLSKPTQRDILANFFMLVIFYVNYYILIPKFYFTGKQIIYFFIITASFLLIAFLPTLLTAGGMRGSHTGPRPHGDGQSGAASIIADSSYLQTVSHIIFLYATIVLFSILLRTRQRYFRTEHARQQAELLSLKAQINPHFLFNTLNSIYSLALAGSDQTANAVVQLLQLMRYILQDTKAALVPLDKELEYVINYLDLQKTRLGETVSIMYTINGNAGQRQIAPMLLMPFIENAFKHGVNPDANSFIKIVISITDQLLNMSVFNNKVSAFGHNEYSGIGVDNTKQRLELLYPDKHKLFINNMDVSYTVHLILTL